MEKGCSIGLLIIVPLNCHKHYPTEPLENIFKCLSGI